MTAPGLLARRLGSLGSLLGEPGQLAGVVLGQVPGREVGWVLSLLLGEPGSRLGIRPRRAGRGRCRAHW
jgi:hypothetical protein